MKLTAAVIGCGRIGSSYDEGRSPADPRSHAGAYRMSDAVSLVAGVDPDADRRREFAGRWGVRPFASVPEMLAETKPDIWSICTPPVERAEIVDMAIGAGARGLWCEKPLAEDSRTAARIAERTGAADVPMAVGYQRRWDRGHQEVATWLRNGRTGDIEHVVIRYTRGLRNYGTHAIDLVRWFVGEIEWVWARPAADVDHVDPSPSVVLGANDAAVALLSVPRHAYDVFEVDVMGSNGRVVIDELGKRIRRFEVSSDPDWAEPRVVSSVPSDEIVGMRGAMAATLANLIDAVTHDARVLCGPADGVRALEVVEAIEDSMGRGVLVRCPQRPT